MNVLLMCLKSVAKRISVAQTYGISFSLDHVISFIPNAESIVLTNFAL